MRRACLVVGIGMLLSAGSARADPSHTAVLLYQEASYEQDGIGDLGKAIELYQEILDGFPADTSLCARARLRIAICYETLGDKEQAIRSYEEAIEGSSGQLDVVREVERGLRRLGVSLYPEESDLVHLPGGARISGTVTDPEGHPVEDVRVSVSGVKLPEGAYVRMNRGPVAETDEKGRYVLTDLRTGTYRLRLQSDRLACYGVLKGVKAGRWDADAVLGLESGVSGRITDLSGVPIPGARVSVRVWPYRRDIGEREPDARIAVSDSGGCYRLAGLPFRGGWVDPDEDETVRGHHFALIEADGYIAEFVDVRPEYGKVTEGIDFRLEPGGVPIAGVVKDSYGMPVIDAEVGFFPLGIRGDYGGAAATGRGGRFSIEGLVDDPYDLVVRAGGFAPAYVASVIGGTQDLEIVLGTGGAIAGTVTAQASSEGSSDPFLSDVQVEVRHAKRSFLYARASTDADGRYRIGGLCPGTYRVRVMSERSPSIRGDLVAQRERVVEVVEGEVISGVDFLLTSGSSVSGRIVYRETRTPAEGIDVSLVGTGYVFGQTDEGGRYRFEGVAPGRYELRTYAGGYVESPYRPGIGVSVGEHVRDFDLEFLRTGSLTVAVLDEEGRPVSDAVVRCENALVSAQVRTDRHGRCRLGGIRPETPVTVFVNPPGYAPAYVDSIMLEPGEEKRVGVRVSSGRTVEGQVADRTGAPVEGARVAFGPDIAPFSSRALRSFGREARTDENGYFRGEHLPERIQVLVLDDGDRFAPAMVMICRGERCDVSVSSGGTVEGYVQDASGEPAAGVRVYFEPWYCHPKTVVTDGEGWFRAERVGPGTCEIRAGIHGRDFEAEGIRVTVVEDDTTVVEIRSP